MRQCLAGDGTPMRDDQPPRRPVHQPKHGHKAPAQPAAALAAQPAAAAAAIAAAAAAAAAARYAATERQMMSPPPPTVRLHRTPLREVAHSGDEAVFDGPRPPTQGHALWEAFREPEAEGEASNDEQAVYESCAPGLVWSSAAPLHSEPLFWWLQSASGGCRGGGAATHRL